MLYDSQPVYSRTAERKQPSRLRPYALPFAAVGLALLIDFELMPLTHRYVPFLFAVLLTAFLTGFGPSLLATMLAVLAANYFDYVIDGQLRVDSEDIVQLAIFLSIALSISILTTKRRRAERNLARANAELRELDRAKDQFIAMLSHELKAPMTVILGWANILRQQTDVELQATAAAAIESSARAQARLVEDLLDMSRLTLGKMHLEIEAVDVPTIVSQAFEAVRPAAETKKIAVSYVSKCDPKSPCTVYGDPLRLQQICWNVLMNAVKFTPDGGHIDVNVLRLDGNVRIAVSDDGDGIAKEIQPHIFEPLRQARSADKGGLGLGLAIVKQLVTMHRGSIAVQSDGAGKGARFTVELPAA
jgi:signal transduction histidine kinase